MEVSKILFRSHAVGSVMPADKPRVQFTETQVEAMIKVYNAANGRVEYMTNKYLEKGNEREEDAITLLSLERKAMYKKNNQRLSNDFITGEWDVSELHGDVIAHTIDTKCSWSKNTFDKGRLGGVDKNYFYQGQCYMWLTGATKHTIAFCLVNGTAKHIMDEKKRLAYRMGIIDTDAAPQEYIDKCKQIEVNHIFDIQEFINENPWFEFDSDIEVWNYNIPRAERIHTTTFDFDPAVIENIKTRIIECRKWMELMLCKPILSEPVTA